MTSSGLLTLMNQHMNITFLLGPYSAEQSAKLSVKQEWQQYKLAAREDFFFSSGVPDQSRAKERRISSTSLKRNSDEVKDSLLC